MKLSDYLKPLRLDERQLFAAECGTTWAHLKNVAFSGKKCGTKLAVLIEFKSGRAVMRWDVCPNDWAENWPELINTPGAPPVPTLENAAREAA